jgi:hypothetical protein
MHCMLVVLIAPVSLHEDPSAPTLDPVRGNPDRMRARRPDPIAGNPDIPSPVPPLIPRAPNPAGMRRSAVMLHNRWRRPDSDSDLGMCGTPGERRYKQCSDQKLSHGSFSPAACRLLRKQTRAGLASCAAFPAQESSNSVIPPIMKSIHADSCTYRGRP